MLHRHFNCEEKLTWTHRCPTGKECIPEKIWEKWSKVTRGWMGQVMFSWQLWRSLTHKTDSNRAHIGFCCMLCCMLTRFTCYLWTDCCKTAVYIELSAVTTNACEVTLAVIARLQFSYPVGLRLITHAPLSCPLATSRNMTMQRKGIN